MTEQETKVTASEEKISEQDKHVLEMAVMQRKLSLANAEKALAENNAAELAHKHIVLQLYMKYGMNVETDSIDEQGVIKRNSITPEQLEQARQQFQASRK